LRSFSIEGMMELQLAIGGLVLGLVAISIAGYALKRTLDLQQELERISATIRELKMESRKVSPSARSLAAHGYPVPAHKPAPNSIDVLPLVGEDAWPMEVSSDIPVASDPGDEGIVRPIIQKVQPSRTSMPAVEPPRQDPLEQSLDSEARTWLGRIGSGRFGPVGYALGLFYLSLPRLIGGLAQRQGEEFRTMEHEYEDQMYARLERFTQVQGGSRASKEWVEQDLVPSLDMMAQLLSRLIGDARTGHAAARQAAEELNHILHERLHQSCLDDGFFRIIPVLPGTTRYDPRYQQILSREAAPGLVGMVVEVKRVGLSSVDGEKVQRPAQVVVGR
jgi:hypothetical protein